MVKARVLIELACEICKGQGKVCDHSKGEAHILTCSGCDGTGYHQQFVSIEQFKTLLEGGSL